MTAIREQALAAMAAKLAAIAGYSFARNPERAWAAALLPAIALYDGELELAEIQVSGADRYFQKATVEITVAAENPGAPLNTAHDAVVEALAGDRTLGGVALDLTEGPLGAAELVTESGFGAYAAAALEITIEFWTAEGDPETLPA